MVARALRSRFAGRIVERDDEGWDDARRAWNLRADQQPQLVAVPATAADVVEVATFARSRGLRIAPQATGHGAGLVGPLEDSVLVSTRAMRDVVIDPGERRARVGPGVQWADVQGAGAAHGLAGLAGSAPDVGVVGYTLGGGLGWLGRRYGLACNSVLAVDLVTVDGRSIRANEDHEPDLFWALRGGGGNFGIVTALEFALYPVRELYAGVMFWPQERAAEVLAEWLAWTAGIPDTVTSIGRLLNMPPLPQVPEPLRGRSFVVVEAACLTTEGEGRDLLEPLRRLGPEIDTFAMIPPTGLGALHMDPPEPSSAFTDGSLLTALPAEAIAAFVDAAGPGSGSPLLSVELRHLGGRLADTGSGHGALAALDAQFGQFTVCPVFSPDMVAAAERQYGILRSAMAPWDAPRGYYNFAEQSTGPADLYPSAAVDRLRRVKSQFDPDGVIRSPHPIPTD